MDGGPWQGPTLEEWLARISPWPIPWIVVAGRDAIIEEPEISETELRALYGDR